MFVRKALIRFCLLTISTVSSRGWSSQLWMRRAHRGLGLVQNHQQAAVAFAVADGTDEFKVAAADFVELHEVAQGVIAQRADVGQGRLLKRLHIGKGCPGSGGPGCSALGVKGFQGMHLEMFFQDGGGFRRPELPAVEYCDGGRVFQLEAFDEGLGGAAVHNDLAGLEAQKLVRKLVPAQFREAEFTG